MGAVGSSPIVEDSDNIVAKLSVQLVGLIPRDAQTVRCAHGNVALILANGRGSCKNDVTIAKTALINAIKLFDWGEAPH